MISTSYILWAGFGVWVLGSLHRGQMEWIALHRQSGVNKCLAIRFGRNTNGILARLPTILFLAITLPWGIPRIAD
jgi:4-hydroxybenzoate polyprenyltransferase